MATSPTKTPAPPSARETAQQFDREFQRYTTKHAGKGAQAVAMARAELRKYVALVHQDKKLEDAKITKGRLTPEQRAAYEKKIVEIEKALDNYHNSIAWRQPHQGHSLVCAALCVHSARVLPAVEEVHVEQGTHERERERDFVFFPTLTHTKHQLNRSPHTVSDN
ncbi:hypothetical protein PINS_up002455 [Pythium insidiosum]|nr:hypothetical protein PINS_up002455 [Pythium insidiosum]